MVAWLSRCVLTKLSSLPSRMSLAFCSACSIVKPMPPEVVRRCRKSLAVSYLCCCDTVLVVVVVVVVVVSVTSLTRPSSPAPSSLFISRIRSVSSLSSRLLIPPCSSRSMPSSRLRCSLLPIVAPTSICCQPCQTL